MEEGLVLVDTNIIIEVLKNNKEIIDAKPERFQVHIAAVGRNQTHPVASGQK